MRIKCRLKNWKPLEGYLVYGRQLRKDRLLAILWSNSESILFSPEFGREIWYKKHFLEGSRRWGVCGKRILWDTIHELHEASYGEHDTYWFLSSVTRVGAPLSSLAHKRPPLGRVAEGRCWKGVWQWELSHPFSLASCRHLIFISVALVFWCKLGLLRNWRSQTQWMWFKTQLTVPALCWRCYKLSLEAGCLYIENEQEQ